MAQSLSYQLEASEIIDNYEHPDDELEYVLENVLSEPTSIQYCSEFAHLQDQYNSVLLNPCECCSSSNESKCYECLHGGNYFLDTNFNELVLDEAKVKDIIYECSAVCKCIPNKCHNRLVQKGPRNHLKIVDSNLYKSKGLITTVDIPRGAFICEYAGELLTHSEARRRTLYNEQNSKMNYILCLNELEETGERSQSTIVDPSRKGNIGRYLNHCCAPNCKIYSVRVDCPVPKIAIFAKRNICANEELCFHYNEGVSLAYCRGKESNLIRGTSCLCGSENCQKYLPNNEF